MSDQRPWGPMDPNSEHQRWGRWVFGIQASTDKQPPVNEVVRNALRYFAKLFQSTTGRVRCDQQGTYYVIVVEIEGPPVHDPEYCARVQADFAEHFVRQGFGAGARLVRFLPALLAGDQQDGQPPDQMLVMPNLPSQAHLYI